MNKQFWEKSWQDVATILLVLLLIFGGWMLGIPTSDQ